MLKIICIKLTLWDGVMKMRFAHQKTGASRHSSCCNCRVVWIVGNGQPLFATMGEVAFSLSAGFSEIEEVRRKINRRQRAEMWSAKELDCFVVKDSAGQKLAYVYFED